jgi:predicted nucleic acid-binding protein
LAADIAIAAHAAVPVSARTLRYRPRTNLPMDPTVVRSTETLLLDTTVYIDGAKPLGLPPGIVALLASHPVRHSALCIGELAFGYGSLDPGHPATTRNRALIADLLGRVEMTNVVALSAAGWAKAGSLAGALSRMQGFAHDRRRALLIDAALFVTAQEAGLTLVSDNISDMDLLQQVGGEAKLLLYDVGPPVSAGSAASP